MPKILVIDDSEFVCKMVQHILFDGDTQILTVGTAMEGIESVRKEQPDLILLDVELPDMDGFDTCIALKSLRETAEIPVVFITGYDGVDDMVRGFEVGAVDYIRKPFNPTELKARTIAHLKNKLMADEMRILNADLLLALEENRRLANKDPLTGLYNRRYGWSYMENFYEQCEGAPSVLLMGDVDDFKTVNDHYGHHMGDAVLCKLAELLWEAVGENGLVCRWGGEEVLVMLHDCTLQKAVEWGTNICQSFYATSFITENREFHCSITLGVAPFNCSRPIEDAINLADKVLYQGKKAGKNCCVLLKKDMR